MARASPRLPGSRSRARRPGHPGKFVQVELMLKNAQRLQRYRRLGLGSLARTGSEALRHGCGFRGRVHGLPPAAAWRRLRLHAADHAAKVSGDEVVNNSAAALPASLPYQPLGWGAITMYVDPRLIRWRRCMAMTRRCRLCRRARAAPAYPAGAVLALVTWAQRDDPHWFGARIPDVPQSVEFVGAAEDSRLIGVSPGQGLLRIKSPPALQHSGPISCRGSRRLRSRSACLEIQKR